MKQVKLKTVVLTNSQLTPGTELDYKREFLRLVEVIPEGATISEMGDLIKIADKLRGLDSDGTLYLEDSEHETLKRKLSIAKFTIIAPEVVEMVNSVNNAVSVEVAHLKAVKAK